MAGRMIAFVLATVALLAASSRAATAQTYQITDLGNLGGGYAVAYDINASGQVVGRSLNDSKQFLGFIWLPSPAFGLQAGMYELETLGGTSSEARGINASGDAVGWASVSGNTAVHAALWPTGKPVVDLGTLGGKNSEAYDINDTGEVVGWSDTAGNKRHAFWWRDQNRNGVSDPGDMVDLGDLGGDQSIAYGINASGQIVGTSSTATFASHAFRTTNDGFIDPQSDLGTLGGFSSTAYRLNDAGRVVGLSQMPGNATIQAFRTAANSAISPGTDGLGTLGGARSEAWGINTAGEAVGWSTFGSSSTNLRAFFSAAGGGTVDLNTRINPALGWTLEAAFAINDSGEIVGSGVGPAGSSRAFLLRPQSQLPAAPTLTASATGSTISLSWAPAPGPAVVSYVLEAGTASGLSDLFNGNVGSATQLSATVPPGRYFVRVRGVNASGTGAASVERLVSIGIPGTPTVTSATESAGVLTVAWSAGPGAPAQSHVLSFFDGAVLVATLPAGAATSVAIPLPPGISGAFGVRVTAFAGTVASAPSALHSFTLGACVQPASPRPSGGIAGGTASVSWPPVAGATSYVLSGGTVPGGTQYMAPTSLGASTGASASGLPPGFTAWIRVVAVSACGKQSAPADLLLQ